MYKKTFWGFAFLALAVGLCILSLSTSEVPLGIDLQGGTRLVYKLDLSRVADDPKSVAEDVKGIIETRLNAFGLKDLSLSIQGEDRLEIQVPGAGQEAVGDLKKQIERSGTLTFHLAMEGEEYTGDKRLQEYLDEEQNYLTQEQVWAEQRRDWLARRAQAEKANVVFTEPSPAKPTPPEFIVRWQGDWVEDELNKYAFKPKVRGQRVLGNSLTLKVEGKFLSNVYPTSDQQGNSAVGFEFSGEGASRFGDLTGNNIGQPLAIVLDEDVMQLATIEDRISTRGILRGRFTNDEVRGIVTTLRGGSLPTKPQLESENTVGSLFGQASVNAGVYAVVIGLAIVMFAISIYYLLAGLVANFALVFNIVAVLTYVIAFNQHLTLPGIAGILLTIGMAVDANILIFERVREERRRGKGLIQALSTGYQRAFSVIFDSNLTTVITGVVLYNFGTVQVRGFAITLIAGILVSFVSALFVTRLIISGIYNLGWLKQLKMMQAFETPRVPFVSYQRPFMVATILVIVASWVLVVQRGKENYGIDFNGGARITMNFREPISQAQLRQHLDVLAARNPSLQGFLRGAILQGIDAASDGAASTWTLLTHLESVGGVTSSGIPKANAQEKGDVPKVGGASTAEDDDADTGRSSETVMLARLRQELERQFTIPKEELKGPAVDDAMLANLKAGILFPPCVERETTKANEGLAFRVNLIDVQVQVTPDSIKEELERFLQTRFPPNPAANFPQLQVEEIKLLLKPTEVSPITSYRVQLSYYAESSPGAGEEQRTPRYTQVADAVQEFFNDPFVVKVNEVPDTKAFEPAEPFPEVSTVSGRVARDLQGNAIVAIFISILGIVFYISLRFEFIFGLAAIAALVHDVLITIGILAVTDQFLGSTLPMKVNLPEVAALLTIIGYSINDTIVVFDRIRENLKNYSKKKLSFVDCVDMSINQTLSRTVWTSATTLVTVLSLLIFGGEAVRGFAYTFAIGLVTGTYSSVFVASPVLILLHNRAVARKEALAAATA